MDKPCLGQRCLEQRYLAQQILPEIGKIGQDKLMASKVLVVGCGGLAASVLTYLTAAGVGELTLIDDDVVELGNLNRQILFTEADVGQNKAESAKLRLSQQNQHIKINAITQKFNLANGLSLVNCHDLVLDCSDAYSSKLAINYCCSLTRKPWVYASVLGWDGQAALLTLHNRHAPCYKCWQESAPHGLRNCEANGVLGAAVSTVGSHQAGLALQYLLGYLHNANCLWVFDLWAMEQKKFQLSKRHNCKFHSDKLENLPFCSYEELRLWDEYVVLDIRSREEWDIGHLPQARHVSPGILMEVEKYYKTTQNLVIYCNQNTLSQLVVENLRNLGYRAFVLDGGYQAYAHLAVRELD